MSYAFKLPHTSNNFHQIAAVTTGAQAGRGLSPAAHQRAQSYRKNRQKPLFFDSALSSNMNYMNVIKESHQSILRRKVMEQEKRRIMDMDFETLKN